MSDSEGAHIWREPAARADDALRRRSVDDIQEVVDGVEVVEVAERSGGDKVKVAWTHNSTPMSPATSKLLQSPTIIKQQHCSSTLL